MIFLQMTQAITGRWRQVVAGSTNRQIFGAAVTIATLTLIVKLASMLKDVLVAGTFGAGDVLDAFLIAFALPSFITNVVAGSFDAALVPVYMHIRQQQGQPAAQQLFSEVVMLSLALLTLVVIPLALVGPYALPLLGSGFNAQKLALTRWLFYLLLPTIVLGGLATIWSAVLNSEERFGLVSITSAAIPVASIFCLLALGTVYGIYALAFGTLAGSLVQLYVLAWGLKRLGLSWRPRGLGLSPPTRQVVGQYVPMVAGMVVMSSTAIVDQAMAAALDSGSVAALNYGSKLVSVATSVGTMALGTAVLPYFSKMVSTRDWAGIRHSLKTYIWLIVLVTIPCTLIGYVFSEPLIRLLFERGQFTGADTLLVSRVQALLLLQVPFYTVGILFVRLISSLRANYILMYGTVISCTLNITLNYVLMRVMGVMGIALSTTLVYVVACIFLAIMLYRRLKQVTER